MPGGEAEIPEDGDRDRPEGFWNDREARVGGEIRGNFTECEPFSPSAVRIDEFRGHGGGCVNVVEETAVNQMPGDDELITIFSGEKGLMGVREPELVVSKAGKFVLVVVAGIGTRKKKAGPGFEAEVKLGGELEMDELA